MRILSFGSYGWWQHVALQLYDFVAATANSSNMRMEEEREKTNSTLLTLIIHRQCGDAVEKRIIVLIWKCYVGQFGYSFSTFKNKGLVRVLSHPSKQLSENETGVFF